MTAILFRMMLRPSDLSLVENRALVAASAFYDEMRLRLQTKLGILWRRRASVFDLIDAAQKILSDYAGPLAQILADTRLTAWLTGGAAVAERFPGEAPLLPVGGSPPPRWPGDQPPLAFPEWDGMQTWMPIIREAVRRLQAKNLLLRPQWNVLRESERQNAFTVAQLQSIEAVGKVRDAVVDAVRTGQAFPVFKKTVDEALDTSRLGTWHLENVFRTGVGAAYVEGQEKTLEHPLVGDYFPFGQRLPIRDSRLTPLCATLATSGIEGTAIYLRSDPVWLRTKPLSHWQCRCGTNALTVEAAARAGLRYAQEWLRLGRQPLPVAHVPEPALDPDSEALLDKFRGRARARAA